MVTAIIKLDANWISDTLKAALSRHIAEQGMTITQFTDDLSTTACTDKELSLVRHPANNYGVTDQRQHILKAKKIELPTMPHSIYLDKKIDRVK